MERGLTEKKRESLDSTIKIAIEVELAKWCINAAEQGDSKVQCDLGNRYYNGSGVKKDYVESMKWYRKSAEQGHSNAKSDIEYLHQDGF